MNTLTRTISSQFFRDAAHYHAFRQHWRMLLASPRKHELRAHHHLLYCMLLGRDWRGGFTPIRNQRKLANGGFYNWGLVHAVRMLRSWQATDDVLAPFEGLVTPEMLELLRPMLPNLGHYQVNAYALAKHGIPDPAYVIAKEPTHE
jgi:hypothetical protein